MERRDVIEQIRSLVDIVELVGGYVPLRRSGQNFMGCCPFHDDKSPSFCVTPSRQTYYCFGCHERGSVFDFVMKVERVEFKDALKILADRAHVQLEPSRSGTESSKPAIYQASDWAQAFFQRAYAAAGGAECRRYVASRGISVEMAQDFGLGFAPAQWSTLVSAGAEAGFPGEVLERSGLAIRGSTRPGYYDRFRNRLTFPIRDTMGRVIAFGARTLDGSEPKYLNSPETDVFLKGRTLFGLDRLRQHPRSEPILVMEGYTDVLMSVQVGVKGAVATLGTAMTPEHSKILQRYSERIVLVYDGDKAGLLAAERGALILLQGGCLEIRVAVLPDGQDPCDFFLARGKDGVADLMDVTVDLLTFLLERSRVRHDHTGLEGRRRAAEELVRAAAAVQDAVARELILGQIGDHLKIPLTALRDRAAAFAPKSKGNRDEPARSVSRPNATVRRTREQEAQLWITQALLNDPALIRRTKDQDLELVPDERVRRLLMHFKAAQESLGSSEVVSAGLLLDLVPDEELRAMACRALLPPDHGLPLQARLEAALAFLVNRRPQNLEVERLKGQVEMGDAELLRDLQRRFRVLKGKLPGGDDPLRGEPRESQRSTEDSDRAEA